MKPVLALVAALALLLLVPVATPEAAPETVVVADLVVPVRVENLVQTLCPSAAAFDVNAAAQTIRFHETDDPVPTPEQFPPGYSRSGCGTLAITLSVPPRSSHLRAYFTEDRFVEELKVPNTGANLNTGIVFNQTVQILNGFGILLREIELFDAQTPSVAATNFSLEPGVPMAGVKEATVRWTFSDLSRLFIGGLPPTPGGEAYAATLTAPHIEFSGIPLAFTSEQHKSLSPSTLGSETFVAIEVPSDATQADVRVELAGDFQFETATAPDGFVWDTTTTRRAPGRDGFNRTQILQESFGGISRIIIPLELIQAHGAGTYTVLARSATVQEVQPGLLGLAILIHLVPVPLAALALRDIRVFEREAFGGYRRTARRLRLVLIAVAAYYLAFMIAGLAAGRLDQMVVLPLSTDASFLYLHVGLALFAFAAIWRTARELYRMTVPKRLAGHR